MRNKITVKVTKSAVSRLLYRGDRSLSSGANSSGAKHMPQSLILNLVVQDAIAPQHLQGYSLQQLFWDLVEAVDFDLGHILRYDEHNCAYRFSALQVSTLPVSTLQTISASSFSKPKLAQSALPKSSVRPIHNSRPSSQKNTDLTDLKYICDTPLEPQTECWWRIALLDDALFDHLAVLWNQIGHETFQLGPASVRITHATIETDAGGWANSCSYQDIYERASSYERDIHLQMVTPIAFHQGDRITPLPTAEAIFQPLRKCWNHYSTLAFAPSLINSIIPSSFDIQTGPICDVRQQSHDVILGCTGHVSFRISVDDPLTTKRINTLADYTQYCGVGYNTRLGLGVIKRISASAVAVGQSTVN